MNVLYASQCQAAPTNPASGKFSKTTFSPQFPQPLCPQLLVSSRGCTWTTQLMSAGWQTVFSIGLNRCPLHLLPDNRHSVGWSSAGCRLISDISLSHSECLRFTFPKSALSVIIGDKSILPGRNHLTWLLWGKKNVHLGVCFYLFTFLNNRTFSGLSSDLTIYKRSIETSL